MTNVQKKSIKNIKVSYNWSLLFICKTVSHIFVLMASRKTIEFKPIDATSSGAYFAKNSKIFSPNDWLVLDSRVDVNRLDTSSFPSVDSKIYVFKVWTVPTIDFESFGMPPISAEIRLEAWSIFKFPIS